MVGDDHYRCVGPSSGGTGLQAVPATRRGVAPGDVARALGDLAEGSGSELIVVGRRHASALESALLGSVSLTAVRDERRPVLVVPP